MGIETKLKTLVYIGIYYWKQSVFFFENVLSFYRTVYLLYILTNLMTQKQQAIEVIECFGDPSIVTIGWNIAPKEPQ